MDERRLRWIVGAAAAGLFMLSGVAYRHTWPAVEVVVSPPPRAPRSVAAPAPSRPEALRLTPPTRHAIPLPFSFATGGYVITLPPLGNAAALGPHRVRLHVSPPEADWRHEELIARPVIGDFAYRGRATPLPLLGARELARTGPLAWDVTPVVEATPVLVAIVPAHGADPGVLRRMRESEARTAVWMSIGEPAPPAPNIVRALPDLAISAIRREPDGVAVHFENRGRSGWDLDAFEVTLAVDGRVQGKKGSLKVPAPGAGGVARFPLPAARGTVRLDAAVDGPDAIPELDERNNVARQQL